MIQGWVRAGAPLVYEVSLTGIFRNTPPPTLTYLEEFLPRPQGALHVSTLVKVLPAIRIF